MRIVADRVELTRTYESAAADGGTGY